MKYLFALLFILAPFAWGAAQMLQNGDFESVKSQDGQSTLESWNIGAIGGGVSSDSHSGKHALSVWNWYVWAQGNACYAPTAGDDPCAGMPIVAAPTKFSGWYKYNLGLNGGARDSAVCQLLLYRADASQLDTIAFVQQLFPRSKKYKAFAMDFPALGGIPDGALLQIKFLSGQHGNCADGSKGECLYLTVDDLRLEFAHKED